MTFKYLVVPIDQRLLSCSLDFIGVKQVTDLVEVVDNPIGVRLFCFRIQPNTNRVNSLSFICSNYYTVVGYCGVYKS